MNWRHHTVILFCFLFYASVVHASAPVLLSRDLGSHCVSAGFPSELDRAAPGLITSKSAPAAFPLFDWPVDHAVYDGVILGLYMDQDSATGAFKDYMCSDGTYDGHLGTDIGIPSFRHMDRGERVYSAAAGIVAWKQDGKFDRNTGTPPDAGNFLGVNNGDGSFTWYYHLRKNSITVEVGDTLAAGNLIALVGSSGFAFGPHLHFEVGSYTPSWTARAPWAGPCNPLPGLWAVQVDYVGDDPLFIHDMGVTTEAAVGGDFQNIPYATLMEGFSEPAVFGDSEGRIGTWVQFQGNIGDTLRVEIRKPDSTLFTWFPFTLTYKGYFETGVWFWNWAGEVGPGDYGTWTSQVIIDGAVVSSEQFVLGGNTEYGPRYTPAGRSFQINGAVQKDTLRMSSLGGVVTHSLLDAPAAVSLANDTIVEIGPTSDQTSRSIFFQVVASDGSGRADTMDYHLVDPSKPIGAVVGVSAANPPGYPTDLRLLPNRPNPFNPRTAIQFELHESGRTAVSVHDVGGRLVRRLLDSSLHAGAHEIIWHGKSDVGSPAASGIYFIRLESGDRVETRKITLAR